MKPWHESDGLTEGSWDRYKERMKERYGKTVSFSFDDSLNEEAMEEDRLKEFTQPYWIRQVESLKNERLKEAIAVIYDIIMEEDGNIELIDIHNMLLHLKSQVAWKRNELGMKPLKRRNYGTGKI